MNILTPTKKHMHILLVLIYIVEILKYKMLIPSYHYFILKKLLRKVKQAWTQIQKNKTVQELNQSKTELELN